MRASHLASVAVAASALLCGARWAGADIGWTWVLAPVWLPIVGFLILAAVCTVLAACAMGARPPAAIPRRPSAGRAAPPRLSGRMVRG